jgi:hypothetical protein
VSSPADRLAAVAPFIRKYAATCPRIHTATNIPQVVDLVVRQLMYDSGGRISYKQALDTAFRDDPALRKAYAES